MDMYMVHESIPSILLLPSELKYHIAELCSPNSLASLSRIHTTYQREAEHALYHTLSICSGNHNSLKCMETLATNAEKASLVRFLAVDFVHGGINDNRKAMAYLLKALINMHTLSDLRLRTPFTEIDLWAQDLADILCEDHFQLQTLYCNDHDDDNVLDLSRIIINQTKLQILGICNNDNNYNLVETLKVLHNAHSPLPIIFALEISGSVSYHNHISIFPTFYSVDRWATMPQLLVESYNKDQGSDMRVEVDRACELSIYLVDSSDIPAISALAKDIATNFSQINWLYFSFKRPCEIVPSQEIKDVISLFPNVNDLNFGLWPGVDNNLVPKIPKDVRMTHFKEWKVACPELNTMSFIDDLGFWRNNPRKNKWSLFE